MQNIPRIFFDAELEANKKLPVDKEIVHYLRRVMRRGDCLIFNNGDEFKATLSDDDKFIIIGEKTDHVDPSNNLTLFFAPIKKIEDLLNMATQMGVAVLQPVITKRTVANHINWERQLKIVKEAAEQSGRNSIPKLLSPIKFDDIKFDDTFVVADERAGHGMDIKNDIAGVEKILIGPEGGFASEEFEKMKNVKSMSLGKTILRAEVAGVVAIAKVLDK